MLTIIIAMSVMSSTPQTQEGLNAFRVTFNQIGKQGGVQRVVIWARTQNDARRQAETIYRVHPTAVVLIRENQGH